VGQGGRVAWRTADQGVLAHTNHFISAELAPDNHKVGQSSLARFQRINQLLGGQAVFTLDDFERFSADRAEGPDDSIFRTGSKPDSTRTMAKFMVDSRPGQAPVLVVGNYDDQDKPWSVRIALDQRFWGQARPGETLQLSP
jgi:hypothetical protein